MWLLALAACDAPDGRGPIEADPLGPSVELGPPDTVAVTESWTAPPPQVDILFVPDFSSSMRMFWPGNHERLLDDFGDRFRTGEVDWRLGLVPAHTDAVRLWVFGDHGAVATEPEHLDDPEFPPGFLGSEAGRQPVHHLIEHDYRGLVRQDAELHVLFATDNVDQSTSIDVVGFLDWFSTLKQAPAVAKIHAITLFPDDAGCTYKFRPSDYVTYTEATGGQAFSICQPWNQVVDALELGRTAAGQAMPLAYVPDGDAPIEGTIQETKGVTFFRACRSFHEQCQVVYEAGSNRLTFHRGALEIGAQVTVTYETAFPGRF